MDYNIYYYINYNIVKDLRLDWFNEFVSILKSNDIDKAMSFIGR